MIGNVNYHIQTIKVKREQHTVVYKKYFAIIFFIRFRKLLISKYSFKQYINSYLS